MPMQIVSALASLPAEGAELPYDQFHLPMPAWAYGAIALGVFFLLLVVVYLFRNTAHAIMSESERRAMAAGHVSQHESHPGGSH